MLCLVFCVWIIKFKKYWKQCGKYSWKEIIALSIKILTWRLCDIEKSREGRDGSVKGLRRGPETWSSFIGVLMWIEKTDLYMLIFPVIDPFQRQTSSQTSKSEGKINLLPITQWKEDGSPWKQQRAQYH